MSGIFRPSSVVGLLSVLVHCVVLTQGAGADEPGDPPDVFQRAATRPADSESPAAEFAAVNGEFAALNKQLSELQQQFADAPTLEARLELNKQYKAVLAQCQERLPKLKEV